MEETQPTTIDNITEQFDKIMEGLNAFRTQTQILQQQIKTLEKNIKKEYRVLKKEAEKNEAEKKAARHQQPHFTSLPDVGAVSDKRSFDEFLAQQNLQE